LYLLFGVSPKILQENRNLIFFIKCNILSIFFLSLLSGVPSIAFRVSELFGVTSAFMFACLVYYLPFKRMNIFILIGLSGLFFYINYFHAGLINPYYTADFK